MKQSIRVVFLWAEITGYVRAVLDALYKKYNVSIDVVHWDKRGINSTQFDIGDSTSIHFHNRTTTNQEAIAKILEDRQPHIIVVSGWMDKGYIWSCRRHKKAFPTTKIVAGIDDQWTGSIRQRLGQVYFLFSYRRLFDYMWISGQPQYSFAQRFGYGINNIISNLYSADSGIFKQRSEFCKRFVFVGRFDAIKAMDLLVDAYCKLPFETQLEWPLVLIGDGDQRDLVVKKNSPNIIHIPFLQPDALHGVLQKGGVGCLTSHKDQWGVVIHEFALMGFPLLLSSGCGAATEFLISGYNGFLFTKGDVNSLQQALKRFTELPLEELQLFSERSTKLGGRINTEESAASLLSVMHL